MAAKWHQNGTQMATEALPGEAGGLREASRGEQGDPSEPTGSPQELQREPRRRHQDPHTDQELAKGGSPRQHQKLLAAR